MVVTVVAVVASAAVGAVGAVGAVLCPWSVSLVVVVISVAFLLLPGAGRSLFPYSHARTHI